MILQSYELLTTLGFLGCAFLTFIFTSMDLILPIHMETYGLFLVLVIKEIVFLFPSLSSLLTSPSPPPP